MDVIYVHASQEGEMLCGVTFYTGNKLDLLSWEKVEESVYSVVQKFFPPV